ncbi:MAG: sigma-54 dependent transcriptional regulator [Desulfovibrio sp.]|nr:sigma-54 dependent transcriptional regulator [Desulfovibrio sp.]
MRILVVDDDGNSLQSLCMVLRDLGHDPVGLQDPLLAVEEARKDFYPLVITDIRMPGMDGLSLLAFLKEEPELRRSDVVLITGHGDMVTAVEALRKGAYDYLSKPINARELAAVVDRSAEHQALLIENHALRNNLEREVSRATAGLREDLAQARHRLREVEGIGLIIAESPAMRDILGEALILHTDPSVPVLIEGETGTGKEIVARFIHYGEGTTDLPFLAINCAAIPHELFESELFGHEAGAFTGSRASGAPGKLEQAGRGTLFLDEVAEMPLALQPKLLRVLQDRAFFRVGGVKKRGFAARIVCAGNRDMGEMVENGSFRRDLYHRLRVGYIRIPPLRERPEDIRPLAEHFLRREAEKKRKKFTGIEPAALDALLRHSWPGNIREMENTIERAVLMHEGTLLRLDQLQFQGKEAARAAEAAPESGERPPSRPCGFPLPEDHLDLDAHIDDLIQAAVARFEGNKSKAAQYLGISRFTLLRRLQGRDKKKEH